MWSTIYDVYSTIKKLQHYRKVSVLVQPSNLGTWKLDPVPLAVVTSASSEPVALPNCRRFPPSITSFSRSLFANSRALAKSLSSVVFLVQLSRQFGLTRPKSRLTQWNVLSLQRYPVSWNANFIWLWRPLDGEYYGSCNSTVKSCSISSSETIWSIQQKLRLDRLVYELIKKLYVSNTKKSTIKRVFNLSLASAVRDMKPFKLEKWSSFKRRKLSNLLAFKYFLFEKTLYNWTHVSMKIKDTISKYQGLVCQTNSFQLCGEYACEHKETACRLITRENSRNLATQPYDAIIITPRIWRLMNEKYHTAHG